MKTLSHSKPQQLGPTIKRLFSYFKGRRIIFAFIIFLVVICGLASVLGNFYTKDVINDLAYNNGSNLVKYCLIVLTIFATGVVANIIYAQSMVRLTQRVLFEIREDLINKMQSLPVSYFDTHTHGSIMTYFTNDVDTLIIMMNDSLANIFLSLTKLVGTIVCLFLINVYLSLIVIFFLVIMFLFMFFNSKAARKYFTQQQDALAELNSKIEEDISGIKVEKAFNHEQASLDSFLDSNKKWQIASENAFYHTQLSIPFNVSLSYFNFAISSVVGCIFLTQGLLTSGIGGLSSYLVFVRTACQPFNYLTMHINSILSGLAGAERIFHFLDEKNEEDSGTVTLKKIDSTHDKVFKDRYVWVIPQKDGTAINKPIHGDIVFSHVNFSYIKGRQILKDISFEVHPGEKIAFVGSTGAGKTTIMSLLTRFYKIDSGSITYDGINIYDMKLESLRRALSMVTQDTHLFTGTIDDNIRYVRRHSTEEEIIEASKNSYADSFIKRMPNGYKTMLYDDGANLSEGQRQLLGLTRATLNQPPVLILDEATSNIDTRSEQLTHEGLKKLMKERTVIVIAHRLSTVRDADEIMVLDNGKIIERGTQTELLNNKGPYYNLYTGKTELA